MLTRIVLWWSAMTAATGAATGFASLVALRWLFGMGEAGVLPSLTRAFGRWLPARERGRAFGLTIMAAALGGAATQPLVVALLERISWRAGLPDLRQRRRGLGRAPGSGGSATTRASTAA